jgi:D-sedoheptulose 7-phosphate isomerase
MTPTEIESYILRIGDNFKKLSAQAGDIRRAADMLIETFQRGGKVLLCGNGGSAADAQHLAAELVGRYLKDRGPLPALALTVDTSALTAIGNDYSFAEVFARQLDGLGQPGDLLVAISTSGNSENILRALAVAKKRGIVSLGLAGAGGGKMAGLCDLCLRVPSERTNHIQEMHIAIGHILCGIVEEAVC